MSQYINFNIHTNTHKTSNKTISNPTKLFDYLKQIQMINAQDEEYGFMSSNYDEVDYTMTLYGDTPDEIIGQLDQASDYISQMEKSGVDITLVAVQGIINNSEEDVFWEFAPDFLKRYNDNSKELTDSIIQRVAENEEFYI